MIKDFILYITDDGKSKIELHPKNGTVWLSQLEIAELFQTTKQNISKHIKSIFSEGELDAEVVVNYQLTTTRHGAIDGKTQTHNVEFYNLDMVLAIGYRVRSSRGAQFRRYASTILKEYMLNGAVLDEEKMQNLTYFKQLQKKIRDIRSSERLFYQQVLDIFATSIDYDGNSDLAREFFQTVKIKCFMQLRGILRQN